MSRHAVENDGYYAGDSTEMRTSRTDGAAPASTVIPSPEAALNDDNVGP
eukprot:CAMPEP_0174849540 /NCGR_PEP_ID=MMETSP1114-20130205/16565_1 /TAXON_ID=312471 /ORGANISM="Neobodo designis, Strain CCAP 1951/1" /LENGTH=48 /DNA_ID= /DNA_START= /DNA_END= /DNA_ORIENTATION=